MEKLKDEASVKKSLSRDELTLSEFVLYHSEIHKALLHLEV